MSRISVESRTGLAAWREELGRAEARRDWDAVTRAAHELLLLRQDHGAALNALGWAAFRGQRFEEATERFERLRAAHPQDARGEAGLARVAFASDRFDDALAHWRGAARLAPGVASYQSQIVRLLVRLGRHADAITALQGLREAHPGDLATWQAELELAQARRDWETVTHAAEKLLSLQPDSAVALYALGRAALELRRTKDARERFERLRAAHPQDARGEEGLARLAFRSENFQESLHHWREAARLAPGVASYQGEIIRLLARLGRHEEAIAALQFLREAHPGHLATWQAELELAPPSRAYPAAYRRFLSSKRRFRLSEIRSGYALERERFQKTLGYSLNLDHPKSFNEKLCWRKLYDRNPLFPVIADKLAVRSYIADVLGHKRSTDLLTPLLFHTARPRTIPFATLPASYVIKANHGCEMTIFVRDGSTLCRDEIIRQCESWLRTPYGYYKHEWAYQEIKPRLLVEELLVQKDGSPPKEYRLQMFDGRCEFIMQDNPDDPYITLYTPDWVKIDASWEWPAGPAQPPPKRLDEMLQIAKMLSLSFDYIRVDFYATDDRIRIGELTIYNFSGLAVVNPIDFDFEIGTKWRLRGVDY
jgi:tetratricopeptide (TPR) repeat protein